MSIKVDGTTFTSLSQNIYANGEKVYEVWVNGEKVYPDTTKSYLELEYSGSGSWGNIGSWAMSDGRGFSGSAVVTLRIRLLVKDLELAKQTLWDESGNFLEDKLKSFNSNMLKFSSASVSVSTSGPYGSENVGSGSYVMNGPAQIVIMSFPPGMGNPIDGTYGVTLNLLSNGREEILQADASRSYVCEMEDFEEFTRLKNKTVTCTGSIHVSINVEYLKTCYVTVYFPYVTLDHDLSYYGSTINYHGRDDGKQVNLFLSSVSLQDA